MKIKNEIEYAMRIVLYLTQYGEHRIISSNEISEKEEIPHLFSLRILKKLEKAGILNIYKGTKGGYKLSRKGEEITLRDVYEAIEPFISVKDCVDNPEDCNLRKGNCALHKVYGEIQKEFIDKLEGVNFRTLADGTYR